MNIALHQTQPSVNWLKFAFPPSWSLMDVGPGGNVLGVGFANDGTSICRTDTGGCYVKYGTNPWQLLITMTSMPAGLATIGGDYDASVGIQYGGTYAAALAPSNSAVIYIFTCNLLGGSSNSGHVLVSSNSGATFTDTGFTPTNVAVNVQIDSGWDHRIAVDPQNAAVVIVGCPTGAFFSSNSGTTFSAISTVGSGTFGNLIAFDPSSSVVVGKTQGIYIATYTGGTGAGVWHSTDGGTTWAQLNSTGMPTTCKKLVVSGDGTVYTVDNSNNLKKFTGGAWSTLTYSAVNTGGGTIQDIAADPNNNSRIVVLTGSGNLSESSDHGATWSDLTCEPGRTATDVPWMATTAHSAFACAACAFNPATNPAMLSVGDGIDVWTTIPTVLQSTTAYNLGVGGPSTFTITGTPPAAANFPTGATIYFFSRGTLANHGFAIVSNYNAGTGILSFSPTGVSGSGSPTDWTIRPTQPYTSLGAGINQLINTQIVIPPSGKPNNFFWDRCQLYLSSPTAFPSNQAFVATNPEICGGWNGDWSATTPTYLAAIFNSNNSTFDTSGFSTDGGQTWTAFTHNDPWQSGAFLSGSIAVAATSGSTSSTQNIVWMPFTQGSGNNRPYFSTNGGGTWTLCTFPAAVPTTAPTGWGSFASNSSKYVCADRVNLNTFYAKNDQTGAIYKSTDGGANWSKVNSGTINTNGIAGTGALKSVPQSGGSTSTAGWLILNMVANYPGSGATDAVVRSKDGGVTWASLGGFAWTACMGFGASVNGSVPAMLVVGAKGGVRGVFLSIDDGANWINVTGNFNSADQINDCDGDKNTPGVWYVATNSTGIYRGVNL